MSAIGEAMMISWAGFGVIIEHEKETEDRLEISISVPEHSYAYSNDGREMSGDALAVRFKTIMSEMGVKRLIVKYRIRSGENWTEGMRKQAEQNMRKTLFRSQY